MITIDLIGRLGNQLFQYAVCRTVAEKNVQVNGENWGSIMDWKNNYDTAIEKQLAK